MYNWSWVVGELVTVEAVHGLSHVDGLNLLVMPTIHTCWLVHSSTYATQTRVVASSLYLLEASADEADPELGVGFAEVLRCCGEHPPDKIGEAGRLQGSCSENPAISCREK